MRSIQFIYQPVLMMAWIILSMASCDDKYGSRKESTPVIESATITPVSFTFGDSVLLSAKVTDPATNLYLLNYEVISGGKTIASGNVPLEGSTANISKNIFVPLVSGQEDNAPVKIAVTVSNVFKTVAVNEISGITGKRPHYGQLYLVTDDGQVVTLTPEAGDKEKYEAPNTALHRSFNYKIAEKLTPDQQIDFTGAVWGSINGSIAMIDANGASAFAYVPDADYTQTVVYDNYVFDLTLTGSNYTDDDLYISSFTEETFGDEVFKTLKRTLEKDRVYTIFGALADRQLLYNLDFFERVATDKVKFLGATGTYTLYFNTFRKNLVVGVDNPAYPDYLLVTGGGIGYPTILSNIDKEHTWWGFGNVRDFILFRKIADNVFQGTLFIHAKDDGWVSFKPYENKGWEGEKLFKDFIFTGEDVLEGAPDGGNWMPKSKLDANAFYRLTIDLNTHTVNVVKLIL